MSNSNTVIDMVAKEALRLAHEKATFIGTVNRSYDDSFAKSGAKIGSTLRVRNPNSYTRRQGSRVMDVQDQADSTQTITVATQDGVDMRFNSAELALDIDELSRRYIEPAISVLARQLSVKIDPHDLAVKTGHAIDFLCEDMKVKVSLKFRGREMAHTEFGFQVVNKFIDDIAPYGHPDFPAKLIGRGIHVMISPLPRNKRAKHPTREGEVPEVEGALSKEPARPVTPPRPNTVPIERAQQRPPDQEKTPENAFGNNPFAQLEIKGT